MRLSLNGKEVKIEVNGSTIELSVELINATNLGGDKGAEAHRIATEESREVYYRAFHREAKRLGVKLNRE